MLSSLHLPTGSIQGHLSHVLTSCISSTYHKRRFPLPFAENARFREKSKMPPRLIALAASGQPPKGDIVSDIVQGLTSKHIEVDPACALAAQALATNHSAQQEGDAQLPHGTTCQRDSPPLSAVRPAQQHRAGCAGTGPALARSLPTVLLYDEAGLELFDRITVEASDEVSDGVLSSQG